LLSSELRAAPVACLQGNWSAEEEFLLAQCPMAVKLLSPARLFLLLLLLLQSSLQGQPVS
jgi:hypothetical protein